MTNFEKIKTMDIEELAEHLCDNYDCDICPAFDPQYCNFRVLASTKIAMIKHLNEEAESALKGDKQDEIE